MSDTGEIAFKFTCRENRDLVLLVLHLTYSFNLKNVPLCLHIELDSKIYGNGK